MEDRLFITIGKYFIAFQFIEGLIDQALLMLWGHENWTGSQKRLAAMSNFHKVEALSQEMLKNERLVRAQSRPEWDDLAASTRDRLHRERSTRNRIAHSQYLFDALKFDGPVVQSARVKEGSEVRFETDIMTEESQNALVENILDLAKSVSALRTQLVHDFSASAE
ncbi:hypothetical protein [Sphingopyxis kveilinensis]|uniref:hypothetical protein n=1 Tax=Sphingopyxis kveilinensis TaxID=3114367 RepID=UPI0030D3E69D